MSDLSELESQIILNSVDCATFKLKPLQFSLSYAQKLIHFGTVVNNSQAQFLCDYDFSSKDFNFKAIAHDFALNNIVSFKKKDDLAKVLDSAVLNGDAQFNFIFASKDFDYYASANCFIQDALDFGPTSILIDFSGDEKKLEIPNISVQSEKLACNLNLICNLQTFQPVGSFFLDHFVLKNKNVLNFEVYFDQLAKGFMCFIPQLSFGNQFFTALQLDVIPNTDSVDYTFSLFDYSHQDSGSVGKISSDGSFLLGEKKFLQTSFSIDNFYLSSAVKSAAFFMKRGALSSVEKFSENLIMSTEIFASSNFSGLTYNIPYLVVANTQKDNEMLFTSFVGNEETTQISQFDLLAFGQEFSMNFFTDYSAGLSNVFFNSAFSLNSIPYNIAGSFAKNENLKISGDYGLNFDMNLGSKKKAQIKMEMLPISVQNLFLTISLDTKMNFARENWNVALNRLEVSDSADSSQSFHFLVSGDVDKNGAVMEKISISDSTSVLLGSGSVSWLIAENIFDTLNLHVALKNDLSLESVLLEGVFSNPTKKAFSELNFADDVFVSALFDLKSSPSSHFLKNQKSGNVLNLSLTALGPVGNPGVSLRLYDTFVTLGGSNVKANVLANYDEGFISVIDSSVSYGAYNFSALSGSFDIKNFAGDFQTQFNGGFIGHEFESPLTFNIERLKSTTDAKSKAQSNDFKFTLIAQKLKCESFEVANPIPIEVRTSKDAIDFSAGTDDFVAGSFVDKKYLAVNIKENQTFYFNLFGSIDGGNLDLDINNFYLDFAKSSAFFNFPYFAGKGGIGKGSLKIAGMARDLDFYGRIDVDDLIFTVPDYISEDLYVKKTAIVAEDNLFAINNFVARNAKGSYVDGSVSTEIEGGGFAYWKVNLKTRDNSTVKAKFNYTGMSYEGWVKADLDILAIMNEGVSVVGKIFASNLDAVFSLGSSDKEKEKTDTEEENRAFYAKVDLDMLVGQRCFVQFPSKENPMLRALVNPNTPIKLQIDTSSGFFDFSADLVLRGGSVVALNRTFYLREGRLTFDGGKIDPLITIRGEIRETDSDGLPVRIYLSAKNQRLSNFNPTFSSSPARSETEIMSLLGQMIVSDDTDSNMREVGINLLAGGINYLAQSLVVSKIENTLRETLKFDIFSLHPTILQNALIINTDPTKSADIGNYLSGSSVYVGKYFGNNIYLDMLLNLEYIEGLKSNRNIYGLKLEPEFGFELESPFALIRWSISPDLLSLTDSWVPGASLSLSWKFDF